MPAKLFRWSEMRAKGHHKLGHYTMNMSVTPIIIGIATSVLVGLVLLIFEYRTKWFARWSKHQISDTHPDAEELRSRDLYVQRCVELINHAKESIIIRTSKMNKSEYLPDASVVNFAIRNARKRNVEVRILVSANYDRLPGAIELIETCGADVRFDPEVPMSDVNYYCADGIHVVIATRQPLHGAQHQRSTSWIEFRSTFLASVLSNVFDRRWKAINTRRLEEYLNEVVPVSIESYGINAVSTQLGKSASSLEQYVHHKPFILFIIGRPGSGKTTIARLIGEHLPSTGVHLRVLRLSDLEYLRKSFNAKDDSMSKRFEKTEDGGYFILDATLYDEALIDLAAQVKRASANNDLVIMEFARQSYLHALEILSSQQIQPDLIIYIKADYEMAIERNRLRALRTFGDKHFVSEKEMRETYQNNDIEDLLQLHHSKTVIIDNNSDLLTGLHERVLSIIGRIKDATQ